MKRINAYLEEMCSYIQNNEVREEVKSELRCHIEDLIAETLAAGKTWDEAVVHALSQMGSPDDVGKELNRVHRRGLYRLGLQLIALFFGLSLYLFFLGYWQKGMMSLEGRPFSVTLPFLAMMTALLCAGVILQFASFRPHHFSPYLGMAFIPFASWLIPVLMASKIDLTILLSTGFIMLLFTASLQHLPSLKIGRIRRQDTFILALIWLIPLSFVLIQLYGGGLLDFCFPVLSVSIGSIIGWLLFKTCYLNAWDVEYRLIRKLLFLVTTLGLYIYLSDKSVSNISYSLFLTRMSVLFFTGIVLELIPVGKFTFRPNWARVFCLGLLWVAVIAVPGLFFTSLPPFLSFMKALRPLQFPVFVWPLFYAGPALSTAIGILVGQNAGAPVIPVTANSR